MTPGALGSLLLWRAHVACAVAGPHAADAKAYIWTPIIIINVLHDYGQANMEQGVIQIQFNVGTPILQDNQERN